MLDTLDTTDLEDFLSDHIEVLIADANEAGFGTDEILSALRKVIERQRLAYDADPDPADDINGDLVGEENVPRSG